MVDDDASISTAAFFWGSQSERKDWPSELKRRTARSFVNFLSGILNPKCERGEIIRRHHLWKISASIEGTHYRYPVAKEVSNVRLFPTNKKFFWKIVSFFYARCCRLSKQLPRKRKGRESKATFVGWGVQGEKIFCLVSPPSLPSKWIKMQRWADTH